MSDFTSGFWNVYIALLTVVSVIGCAVLLWTQSKAKVAVKQGTDTTGHVWDETLAEYNNPLPNWWRWLFYITIVFSLGYLAYFPGLGSFAGASGWTSTGQYDAEMKQADAVYGPIFAKYAGMDIPSVAADPKARAIGERIFLNNCAQCHGSDARGSKGFPNLADGDWLYGGTPEAIKTSILEGRNGVMPPMAAAIGGEAEVRAVAEYVLSLSASPHDPLKAQLGKEKFEAVCAACHQADGKGNPQIGAPNLTDKVWLYGSGVDNVVEAITKGRAGKMPAHKEFLGESKVHIVAAWVWGLTNTAGAKKASTDPAAVASSR